MYERIITRPDFDGIVCAVLLKEALGKDLPVLWAQPNEIQAGQIVTGPGDIVSNLPLLGKCALWFDHHISNETRQPHAGLFRIAPSAAGLIFEYFGSRINHGLSELVRQTDKIDSADLSLEEILYPEKNPYILVSMTVGAEPVINLDYCNRLVALLGTQPIDKIMADSEIQQRCAQVVSQNKVYEHHLKAHTRVQGQVAITDFRQLDPAPNGNRFLVYSLFPETVVNMKIFNENTQTVIKLGHSIINRGCHVNVGQLLAAYGGGGHRGAGACRLAPQDAEAAIRAIVDVLVRNHRAP